VYRFGLNAHGEHHPNVNLNFDSKMFLYADRDCKECKLFAEQIRHCAEAAKWTVNSSVESSPISLRNQRGIIVHGNADGPGGEPELWLSKMGFGVTSDYRSFNPDNPWEIKIFVEKQ
jgi:hypothetical protein